MENTKELLINKDNRDFEDQVGILEFINTHESIEACYKYRYSDFIVIEVGEHKEKCIHDPKEPEEWKKRIDNKEFIAKKEDLKVTDEQAELLKDLLNPDQIEEIRGAYDRFNNKEKNVS